MLGIALLALVPTIGVAQPSSLPGTWRLEEAVTTGANPAKAVNPEGFVTFGKTYYVLIHVEPAEPRQLLPPLKTPGKPTDAEKVQAADHWAPLITQAGTYEVMGTTLTLRPIVAKTQPFTQLYTAQLRFEGNTLWTTVKLNDGRSESRRRYTRVE